MDAIYRMLNNNYMRLQRHAFQTHPQGHSMFQDLDDLIRQKENFIEYIKFEYSLAVFYNLVVAVPSLIFLISKFSNIISCDMTTTLWLVVVTVIKFLEILPKGKLIYQTIRVANNSNDPIICSRRLMYMTRSNVFFYNTILGYCLLISYTLYFLLIRKSSPCKGAMQFYFIINWLVFGFFLRLIISFINFFLHFKYGINEADLQNINLYTDYQNRCSPEVINMIDQVVLNEKNIDDYIPILLEEKDRDCCSICIEPYEVDQKIKILPCNRKHIFHKECIEKWLSHNKVCPTCRKEISKKLIQKSKIY